MTRRSFYSSQIAPKGLVYQNSKYGFEFSLPESWKRYSVIETVWNGRFVGDSTEDASTADNQVITGPEILIRHPAWTTENPRQDIPIMIFTFDQWNLIQQEKLSLGAAPIGPSELESNATYVFALPARYNFAFPVGFEEVDQIIQSKPLRGM
jgi:hypothetical protein